MTAFSGRFAQDFGRGREPLTVSRQIDVSYTIVVPSKDHIDIGERMLGPTDDVKEPLRLMRIRNRRLVSESEGAE